MNLEEQINNINAEIELKNNEIAELCKKIEDTKFENATTIIGKCYSYEHTDCELCSQFLKILDFNKTYGDDEYNDYVYTLYSAQNSMPYAVYSSYYRSLCIHYVCRQIYYLIY